MKLVESVVTWVFGITVGLLLLTHASDFNTILSGASSATVPLVKTLSGTG